LNKEECSPWKKTLTAINFVNQLKMYAANHAPAVTTSAAASAAKTDRNQNAMKEKMTAVAMKTLTVKISRRNFMNGKWTIKRMCTRKERIAK